MTTPRSKTPINGRLFDEKPIVARTFALAAAILLLCWPTRSGAQTTGQAASAAQVESSTPERGEVLTLSGALSRALDRPQLAKRQRAEERAARAEIEERSAWENPTLQLNHDQVFGDINVGYLEFSLGLQQPLDLSNWRHRLRASLPHRARALESSGRARERQIARRLRLAYYSVLYHQRRLESFGAWITILRRGVGDIRARQKQGDASLYALRRVQRELALARARHATESARLTEAWSTLRALAPFEKKPKLLGQLAPSSTNKHSTAKGSPSTPSPGEPSPGSATSPDGVDSTNSATSPEVAASFRRDDPADQLPQLQRLLSLERATQAEIEAWTHPFWRGWNLGAGYRFARVGDSIGHGFLLSLSLPLTVFSSDRARLDRLQAQQVSLQAERLFLRRRLLQRRRAAERRLSESLKTLSRMPTPSRERALTRLATDAYQAGEARLSELLDAYQSETELQLARIDLQWEARRAALQLRALQMDPVEQDKTP